MKKLLFLAVLVALFISCEKEDVNHTGDPTGTLYGAWALDTKTTVYQSSGEEKSETVDYSKSHFFLLLSRTSLALAKKGSLSALDLKDVDVDGVFYTYDSGKRKIRFKDPVWLSDEFLSYNMILDGTFDVEELTDKTLVLSQYQSLFKTKTIYTYHRYFTDNN